MSRCNIKIRVEVGLVFGSTTMDKIHDNMRSAKLLRTNNNFPNGVQIYHVSILSKIVSTDMLSLLVSILDTTSQLVHISLTLTPQLLYEEMESVLMTSLTPQLLYGEMESVLLTNVLIFQSGYKLAQLGMSATTKL
jgi:hypothetical protein